MNLEDLKKGATTSEWGLIYAVEKLVRSEYDVDVIRKMVHKDLINEIQKEVTNVLMKHGAMGKVAGISCMSYGDRHYIQGILYEIGDAIRLTLTEPSNDSKI
jgi:hypothetical protein